MPHIHEKIDFVVEVFIVHGDKVLLRKHDKYKMWLSIGGHIELDEDPIEAAIREAKEEVGLDIVIDDRLLDRKDESSTYKELIPPRFLNRHQINDTHEHVEFVYFARSWSDQIVADQGVEQSDEIRWFTQEDLALLELTDRIRYYAQCALLEVK